MTIGASVPPPYWDRVRAGALLWTELGCRVEFRPHPWRPGHGERVLIVVRARQAGEEELAHAVLSARIAVIMLDSLDRPDLPSIVAHEIGHILTQSGDHLAPREGIMAEWSLTPTWTQADRDFLRAHGRPCG